MRVRLMGASIVANVLGAVTVFVFLAFLVPLDINRSLAHHLILRNAIVGGGFLAMSLSLGIVWGWRRAAPLTRWIAEERTPTAREREYALHRPREVPLVSGLFWLVASIAFPLINLEAGNVVGVMAAALVLGGATTSALGYLLAERLYRPVTVLALAVDPPSRPTSPGVSARILAAWLVATGVPVLGVIAVGVVSLAGETRSEAETARAVLFLAGLAVAIGLPALFVTARSIADPLAAVRAALGRVEGGDLDARVAVDDGSEIGLVQAGFNRMAEGLAERERLRDLFGRHVGTDVARRALDEGVGLGGEEREIAALFVDVIGSTALATERPPGEVVALLNRFFAVVVEVVDAHGGLVNKFEGDAALCVFGAPVARDRPAADALPAALELASRLHGEVPGLQAAIGVAAGPAVAGNVGAEHRLEYTVIGDAVNEAARLCELAKHQPGRLLTSEAALRAATDAERREWRLGDEVVLRGRATPTRLAAPASL